jgi:hypothetical protein
LNWEQGRGKGCHKRSGLHTELMSLRYSNACLRLWPSQPVRFHLRAKKLVLSSTIPYRKPSCGVEICVCSFKKDVSPLNQTQGHYREKLSVASTSEDVESGLGDVSWPCDMDPDLGSGTKSCQILVDHWRFSSRF